MTDTRRVEAISKVLHDAQLSMPAGQSWNLYSKRACDQLAEKICLIDNALETQRADEGRVE